MSTLLWTNQKTWLAHRGSWHCFHHENTIPAFNETVKRLHDQLHGIECDLRQYLKRDPSSWVIKHDPFLQKNKRGWAQFQKSTKTLLLPNFCEWILKQNKPFTINIEIKNGTSSGVAYLINHLLGANKKNIIRYIFSTFDFHIFKQLATFNHKLRIGFLIQGIDDLDCLYKLLPINQDVAFIGIAHEHQTKRIQKMVVDMGYTLGVYFLSLPSFYNNLSLAVINPDVSHIFTED